MKSKNDSILTFEHSSSAHSNVSIVPHCWVGSPTYWSSVCCLTVVGLFVFCYRVHWRLSFWLTRSRCTMLALIHSYFILYDSSTLNQINLTIDQSLINCRTRLAVYQILPLQSEQTSFYNYYYLKFKHYFIVVYNSNSLC